MSDFGDLDPEDAWDAADSRPEKLGLLVRILVSIAVERLGSHDHQRVLTRLAFAEEQTTVLAKVEKAADEPILAALLVSLFYLSVAEGP